MKSEFVHLHNHSDYSLLDGAQTVQTLVNTIDDLGMDSVALTEHGNMFSVLPYYKSAKKAGIKPIIGCEVYDKDQEYIGKIVNFFNHGAGKNAEILKNNAPYFCTSKTTGDVDKLTRSTLDALSVTSGGTVLADDSLVVCLQALKRYAKRFEHIGANINIKTFDKPK